jgi:Transglycosylase SLT domain
VANDPIVHVQRMTKINPSLYQIAGPYAREVRAFAIVESGEQPYPIGDNGEAFGLLQIHPANFKQFYGSRASWPASVLDTWLMAEIKNCAAFLDQEHYEGSTQPVRNLIIQAWNLGVNAVFNQGKRNPEYLAKWQEAYATL